MKFLDEYRDEALATKIVDEIRRIVTKPWVLMEVCGGQTHTIVKYGIDRLLPDTIELVHGPGCPVCVTSLEMIDKAHAIAQRPDVIFCSFGDMLRVPGSKDDLLILKSRGADIRVVYSPIDCLKIARANPDKKVVFFAIGFETTAPANAMSVFQAQKQGIKNFSILVSHVLVPPSIASILQSPLNRVQGFLGPGHVCTVMGYREYEPIADRFKVPIVITGFEPIDILEGVLMTVRQLEAGSARSGKSISASRPTGGQPGGAGFGERGVRSCDRKWRGVGSIPKSGYKLRYEFRDHDAERIFETKEIDTQEPEICISGLVLKGVKKPHDCPAFGKQCTPEHPLGRDHGFRRRRVRRLLRLRPAFGKNGSRSGSVMKTAVANKVDKHNETFRDKILRKCGESVEMKEKFFEKYADDIERLSRDMAKRFADGKKLLTMGNGGSLCDALHFAVEFTHPIIEKRAAFPVISLMTDIATMTAVSNDIDFSRVFVNQLRLLGQPGDMALAVSTSGKSPNLIYALEEARKKANAHHRLGRKRRWAFPGGRGLLFYRAVLQYPPDPGSARYAGARALGFDPHRPRRRRCHLRRESRIENRELYRQAEIIT